MSFLSKLKIGIQYTSTLILNRAANGAAGVRELVSYAGPLALAVGALWKSVGLFESRKTNWTVSKIQTSLYEQPWNIIRTGNYSSAAKATAEVCFDEASQRAVAVMDKISLPTQESMLWSIVNNDWINPALKLGWWLSTFASIVQFGHLVERVSSEFRLQVQKKDQGYLKAAGYAALALFINPRTRKFDLFANLPYSTAAFYLFNWVLQPGINHVFDSYSSDKFTAAVNGGVIDVANGRPFTDTLYMVCDAGVLSGGAWLQGIINAATSPEILTPLILMAATIGVNYLGDLITSYYNLRHPAIVDADGKTLLKLTTPDGFIDTKSLKEPSETEPLSSESTRGQYSGGTLGSNSAPAAPATQITVDEFAQNYNKRREAWMAGGLLNMLGHSINSEGVASGDPERLEAGERTGLLSPLH